MVWIGLFFLCKNNRGIDRIKIQCVSFLLIVWIYWQCRYCKHCSQTMDYPLLQWRRYWGWSGWYITPLGLAIMKDSNDKSKNISRQIAIRERWDELSLHMYLYTSKGPTDLQTTVHQNSHKQIWVLSAFSPRSVSTLGVFSSAGKNATFTAGKNASVAVA